MSSTTRKIVGALFVATGIVSALNAGPRAAGGGGHHGSAGGGGHHSSAGGGGYHGSAGGGGYHGSAAPHSGGQAVRVAPYAGYVRAHGTAAGHARYGYYRGGWGGYGYWGGGYPYWGWGVGWYGGWGWPGYGYYGYAPWYPSYVAVDAESDEQRPPSGPATVVTAVTPSKAEVELDGESVGFASDYNGKWDKLTLAPGHHEIVFKHKGRRSLTIAFEARPGATYAFDDTLPEGDGADRRVLTQAAAPPHDAVRESAPQAAATGRLRLHVDPADAAIYLDGSYLGLGAEIAGIHGALAVGTGSHRLEVVRPGYTSTVRTIEVGETDLVVTDVVLEHQP